MTKSKGIVFIGGLLVAVFLIIRFSNLLAFPIFNDEGIYLQYSQLIHQDFSKFRFISIDNVFHDWKPPLQYWLGAITIGWVDNPLLAGRLLSAFFWLLGAIGIYLLGNRLWSWREGFWAAFFYFLNPPVLFYGGQFIAEVYVWTAAIWLFVCLAALMSRSQEKVRPLFIVGGIVSGAALLLFKQAGFLYFYLAWLWPFFYWPIFRLVKNDNKNKKEVVEREQKRRLWRRNTLTAFAVLAIGFLFYKMIIPANLFSLEKQFTGQWTLSLGEIFSWPTAIWSANLNLVWDFFQHYYSPAVLLLAIVFSFLAFWRRQREEIMASIMFWLASLAVVFGLRGFNEYLYHTGVIVFLLILLGRFSANLSGFWQPIGHWSINWNWRRFWSGLGLVAILFIVIFWSLQIYLLKENPAGYLARGTSWLRGNNLLSWANGFNVPVLIEMLRQQPNPSIAFVDPQWGNPSTALQVFQKYYPQVKIAPITPELLQPDFLNKLQAAGFKSRLAIFSKQGNAPDVRNQWQQGLEANLCGERLEFRTHADQTPIVVCLF